VTAAGVFALAALALWALLFLRGLQGIRRTPVLAPAPDVEGEVTAYVPARDEVEVIERAVQGALSQAQVARLVVIDDRSSDGTGEALARLAEGEARLVVLSGRGPGEGECGKPAALVQAYEAAPPQTEWLLFLDADVVLGEGAIGALLSHAGRSGADLVTVIPTVTLGTFMERLVMPAIGALVLAHHPPARVADPDDPKAFANGQVILLRRARYERLGGHRRVLSDVLEDVALARHVKAAGGRLSVVDGRRIARTRMYASWSELSEGWIKNLFLLMDAKVSVALGWALASVIFGSLGWVVIAVERGWVGLVCGAAIITMQGTLRKLGGASPGYALLAPVGALVASGLLLVSAARHRSGRGVAWKGRRYGSS